MKKRLLIYCEGQTEGTFVNRVLRPHLQLHGVKVERAELALTSLSPVATRGGFTNWEAIDQDLRDTFAQDSDPNLRITTLLDVYRIPAKVPGMSSIVGPLTAESDVTAVEQAMEASFGEPRFKAYLQRHEVEALLLADPRALAQTFHHHATSINTLASQIASFTNVEDIDHGSQTHPAARLEAAIPGYQYLKADNFHWVLASADLSLVRLKCPRFDQWLSHWEQWGAQ